MIDEGKQPPRCDARAAGMSPEVRHLLEQSERAFRLARAMTNRADAEWLQQIGRSFLEKARLAAEAEGEPIKRVPR
jgi:hypothetical protein